MSKRLCLILLMAGLTACVSQPRLTPGEVSWTDRQTLIQGMDPWQVRGRVALTVAEEGGKGRLSWHQEDDAIELTFRGPFGAGGFRIVGTLGSLTLTTKAGDSFLSADPQADLREQVGWSVPIRSLGYWIRGIPDPAYPIADLSVDEFGLLTHLRQAGWQMTYERYRVFDGRDLPRKLVLIGDNVKLKMVIDHWKWGVALARTLHKGAPEG